MGKLWSNSGLEDSSFERFTIGQDPVLDLLIAKYDLIASRAHAGMLHKIGVLTTKENEGLVSEIDILIEECDQGVFSIREGVEDCHSEIEIRLTETLGDVGKKIHTGRSRNDQVLVALKLFLKDELENITLKVKEFFDLLIQKSETTKNILMPGFTHMQVAMPASFGMWFSGHAESLIDDLHLLKAAYTINDSNPLGTAAGYGNSFALDRKFTTDLLKFKNLVVSPINAQITRGKLEKTVSFAISSVASTLSKLSMDIVLFSGENFGFFDIERKFTTGSSIMPHKKNPDGFELIRGYCNQIQSLPYEISLVVNNLPSGYHRDFQVLKTHLFPAIGKMKECLSIMIKMIENLGVSEGLLEDKRYEQIFSVENVNKLVQSGHSFRDAYKILAQQIELGEYKPEKELNHTHIGSIDNLSNNLITQKFNEAFFLDSN